MKKILMCAALLVFVRTTWADIVVAPSDLSAILRKVSQQQKRLYPEPKEAAKVTAKDGWIAFTDQSGEAEVDTFFNDASETIAKHIRLKQGESEYAFSVTLQKNGKAYRHDIQKVNGADALVFFNDEEVFVYTQTAGQDGRVELKEWIYARRPNTATGSVWQWDFVADQMQWPLTLEIDDAGQTKVNRHVPIAGLPIDIRARYNYMMQMMLKPVDDIKKYFPFQEEMASIPPIKFWTLEGLERQADITVLNASAPNPDQYQPHRMNFKEWDKRWQSAYTVSVKADPKEYPLLLHP